jgi:crossover junction endodeoxyribonuclease RuvC
VSIIGVDPGLSGAIAALTAIDGVLVWDMPTVEVVRNNKAKKDVDYPALARIIEQVRPGTAFVERVGSMPGQGLSSTFAFGKATGAVLGVLAACGWLVQEISPQSWKKHFGLVGKEKDDSRIKAIGLFSVDTKLFMRKKDVGRADAALIAAYGHSRIVSDGR